jgi:hypothetical protein
MFRRNKAVLVFVVAAALLESAVGAHALAVRKEPTAPSSPARGATSPNRTNDAPPAPTPSSSSSTVPPAVSTDQSPGSGHTFVVDHGSLRPSGDDRRTSRPAAHLTEARDKGIGPRQAVEQALLAGLVDAGLPAGLGDVLYPQAGADPHFGPWLEPVGDLDADGRDDVLAMTDRWSEGGPNQLEVAGVRGVDGTTLWSRTFTGGPAGAVPAIVDGHAGAIVVQYMWKDVGTSALVAGGGTADLTLTLTAVDHAGQTAWSRAWTGTETWAWVDPLVAYVGTVMFDGMPFLAGFLDGDGGPDTDVLVTQEDLTLVCAAVCVPAATVTADVVDGESHGATASTSHVSSNVAEPWPFVAPDLTGAGHDEVLYITTDGGGDGVVDAFSAADGLNLWSVPATPLGYYVGPVALGDLTGTGGTDVGLSSGWYAGEPTLVLRGNNGMPLWTKQLGFPARLAGVGPDGHDAVGSQRLFERSDSIAVLYEAFDGAGNTVYSRRYQLDVAPDNHTEVQVFPALGDVDGDGVSDSGHRLAGVDFANEQFARDSGAVSGRTGDKLWTGVPGIALPRDHDGQDLLSMARRGGMLDLTRLAGATGANRWTTSVPGDFLQDYAAAADVDGDGMVDLLATGVTIDWEAFTIVSHPATVLDGRTGRVLWTYSPPMPSSPRTETKPYTYGAAEVLDTGPVPGGLTNNCRGSDTSSGGTCFQLDGTERTALFAITDDAGIPVSGSYSFTDDALPFPTRYDGGTFCGSTAEPVEVPPGAVEVWVFVKQLGDCGPDPATAGTITATFG